MRVMVLGKATKETEAGTLPTEQEIRAMTEFNEQLVKAGVVLGGEGLQPTAKGKRVRFDGKKRTVIDGPFMETKELIAGYQIWQVKSMDEAVEWVKRAPLDGGTEVELRPMYGADDLGEGLTPELRAREEALRAEADRQQRS